MSRATSRTNSPGVPRRNGARSRSFQPSQKNLWKSVKTRRERSPNFRQKQKTTVIGPYRIEDTVVGRGAWSVVKPAIDLISGTEYVSKIVRKEDLHYRLGTDEVTQEVAVLKHLPTHRHIVKFIDLLDQADEYLVILESLSNGDLCDAILECDDNRIPEERSKSYFIMMTEALICCHANGVSHRDVKPENMLLSDKYELKLTDFGLARTHRSTFRCTPDEFTTELVGTLRYAAPELFRGHFEGIGYDDYISDVWSLGVCLYVMLAGVFPFSTGKYMDEAQIRDILYSDDKIEMPTSCSQEAVQLLQKLLQKEPEDRIDIRDILNEPWCQGATKPNDPSPVVKPPTPDWESMERDELLNNVRRQSTTIEEQDRTVSRLRLLVSEMEGKLEDALRENENLAQRLADSEKSDFAGLRNKMKHSTQMLSEIHKEAPKRSITPSSAQRNMLPSSRGKTSSSPIVSRKPPSRCASPGVVGSIRSHDSSNYGSPATKPRTLSPRPVTKGPSSGKVNGSVPSRVVRPDSPGKNTLSARTRNTPASTSSGASRSPVALRTTTPPKKLGGRTRLTTASPSRTPPAPARSAVHNLGVSASPGVKERGQLPVNTVPSGNGTKPFETGDLIMYTNKAEGFQCEGIIKYYGRGDSGRIAGIEVVEVIKGTPPAPGLHDGQGIFHSPTQNGLLVLPKDCRLIQRK
eukprot:TRINITY_DN3583_c2_g1_i1.p1 TRINITY_DN3583_c2_g1~~TRINITY_DN3583_c2_g1_i1.p1  ORF type:complete len:690 (+),score=108.47 TRINITY_DN3583_c2_g1_i1:47-2116(+)